MPTSFKPIGSRVLVLEHEPEDNKSASGLILTSTNNNVIVKGTVIKVSKSIDELIKEDNVVYYDRRAAIPLKLKGANYSIIDYKHIQAIEE